jgi:hypothetical protein
MWVHDCYTECFVQRKRRHFSRKVRTALIVWGLCGLLLTCLI